jgi:MFS family permease
MGRVSSTGLWTVLAIAPVALAASLVFGFAETTSFTLLPLYGLAQGYQPSSAALLLSVLIAGNVVLQIPIGWLGDRRGRVPILILCAVLGALSVASWPLTLAEPWLAWPVLLLGGGLLGGMYTLSLATLGERFKGSDLAVANTAFVTLYQLGAMVGPPLGGFAMGRLGPGGLPLVVALALAGFVGAALTRRRRAPVGIEGGAEGEA